MAALKPHIILFGVDKHTIHVLSMHLGNQFQFLAVEKEISMDILASAIAPIPNSVAFIKLFIINTDYPRINTTKLITDLHTHPQFSSIPMIGLSLKKHYPDMSPEIRFQLQDVILMPANTEDIITRVDLWIQSYKQKVMMPPVE